MIVTSSPGLPTEPLDKTRGLLLGLSMNVQEMVARTERRIAAHIEAGVTADVIIADHPDEWREYVVRGVFSQRRTSYETAMKRLADSRARFGEDNYQSIVIGFAVTFKLYPQHMIS